MYFQALLLPVLALAIPIPLSHAAPTLPTSFDARAINYFRPDTSRNPNPSPSFTFSYADRATNVSTSCATSGDVSASAACADPVVGFSFNTTSNTLTVTETLSDGAAVSGDLSLSLNCYPVIPPVPLGYGTLCQNVGGTLTGFFTRAVA